MKQSYREKNLVYINEMICRNYDNKSQSPRLSALYATAEQINKVSDFKTRRDLLRGFYCVLKSVVAIRQNIICEIYFDELNNSDISWDQVPNDPLNIKVFYRANGFRHWYPTLRELCEKYTIA